MVGGPAGHGETYATADPAAGVSHGPHLRDQLLEHEVAKCRPGVDPGPARSAGGGALQDDPAEKLALHRHRARLGGGEAEVAVAQRHPPGRDARAGAAHRSAPVARAGPRPRSGPTAARSRGSRRPRRPGRPASGSSVTSTWARTSPPKASRPLSWTEPPPGRSEACRPEDRALQIRFHLHPFEPPALAEQLEIGGGHAQRWPPGRAGVPLACAEKSRRPPTWPPSAIRARSRPRPSPGARAAAAPASARRFARTAWRVPLASSRPPNSSARRASRGGRSPSSSRKVASTDWMRGKGATASCCTAERAAGLGRGHAARDVEREVRRFGPGAAGRPGPAAAAGRSRWPARPAPAPGGRPRSGPWRSPEPPGTSMVMPWVLAALRVGAGSAEHAHRAGAPARPAGGCRRRSSPSSSTDFPDRSAANRNAALQGAGRQLAQAGRDVAVGGEAGEGQRGLGLLPAQLGRQGQRAAPGRLEAQAFDGDGHGLGQVEGELQAQPAGGVVRRR